MKYRVFALLMIAGVFAWAGSANAFTEFTEDWNLGVIDPGKWWVQDLGAVNVELVDPLGNGDYALALVGQLDGHPAPQWGDMIYSVSSFARTEGMAITFKTWEGNGNVQYSSHGGFHSSPNGVSPVFGANAPWGEIQRSSPRGG